MDGTDAGNRVSGILRLPTALRQNQKYLFLRLRAPLCGRLAGFQAHRDFHMDIAVDFRGCVFRKILAVYSISPGVRVADSPDRQFSGLPAHIGPAHRGGNRKFFVLQPLVNPVHNLFPYIFVIRRGSLYGLIVVIAAPDSRGIAGREADKPQIPAVCGGSAFSRGSHGGQGGPPACGTYGGNSEFALALHGVCHGIGEEKRCLRPQCLIALRLVFQKHVAVMVQHLCKKRWLCVYSLGAYGAEGCRQF